MIMSHLQVKVVSEGKEMSCNENSDERWFLAYQINNLHYF
jgi:hypothetical protein